MLKTHGWSGESEGIPWLRGGCNQQTRTAKPGEESFPRNSPNPHFASAWANRWGPSYFGKKWAIPTIDIKQDTKQSRTSSLDGSSGNSSLSAPKTNNISDGGQPFFISCVAPEVLALTTTSQGRWNNEPGQWL
ncbi:predicted protein [Histoplasma capsulatum H143]|uniref:Uncharacterized protein n=1 Tax=Ajellomyces capsulatus (strain H143) TaxID=544712 RepID=C6H1W2_AJECH|nr:predicted protein [Histoplasma capsulatum H143]